MCYIADDSSKKVFTVSFIAIDTNLKVFTIM